MADGARFDIQVAAQGIGVDATTEQLNAFADRMESVDKVATTFDAAVSAASKRLGEVSTAAQEAADALGKAQSKYSGLEREADKAAKALEKAASQQKSAAVLEKLSAASAAAAAAMHAQASVVGELEKKSKAANAEQAKLAGTLKTLEGRQKGAADASKKTGNAVTWQGAQFNAMAKAGALAFLAVGVAAVAAVGSMARFAIASNPLAMMRLNLASQRLQFSLIKLFRGLDLGKFLGAIDRMGALFDTTNTSGRALKLLIETIMQPIFDAVAKAEPYVSEFFKGMISGALDVVIAVLKLRNAIFKAMSPKTRAAIKGIVDRVMTLSNAFLLGEGLVVAFAVVVGGVLLIALAAAAIAAASLAAALSVIAAIVVGVVIAIGVLVALALAPFLLIGAGIALIFGKWDAFKKWITTLATDAVKWGGDIVDGMINGITGRTKDLGGAMKGGVDAVQNAVKGGLKIHSPSLVMQDFGEYTSAGFARGIEGGEGDVSKAATSMVGGVESGVGGGVSTSSTRSSSRTLRIEHLHIGDSPVAADTWSKFRAMLLGELEFEALAIGGGEVPT